MENKKCSQMMEKYLELDKNTRLPVSVTTHLLFCKECRSKILLLSKAQKLSSQILKISSPVTDQSIINVLEALPEDKIQKIRKNQRRNLRRKEISGWLHVNWQGLVFQ